MERLQHIENQKAADDEPPRCKAIKNDDDLYKTCQEKADQKMDEELKCDEIVLDQKLKADCKTRKIEHDNQEYLKNGECNRIMKDAANTKKVCLDRKDDAALAEHKCGEVHDPVKRQVCKQDASEHN